MSNLDKPWYLHCNTCNNVPIPILAYDYTVIDRSLLCNCQLQGGNEFLHESLASCPSADKVDKNLNFTGNIAFAQQLQMSFPEAVLPGDFTSKLIDTEPSFSGLFQEFTDPESNLESLAKRPKLLKELMQQMKTPNRNFYKNGALLNF